MIVQLELLGSALFILAIVIVGFVWWTIRYMLVELPKRQKDIFERFAPCVVNQVVMEYGILPEYQQKQIAVERMRNIFDDERIDQPGDTMIEAAIADAMYKKKMQEADLWIEELKADQVAGASTMEMPITPAEGMWML